MVSQIEFPSISGGTIVRNEILLYEFLSLVNDLSDIIKTRGDEAEFELAYSRNES